MIPLFFVLCFLTTLAYFFFRWSDNLAMKKKYWVPFMAVAGASYSVFFLVAAKNQDNPATMEKIALGVVVLAVVTSFTTRFCNQCSMMEVRRRRWFSDEDVCRRCGNNLS